MLRTFRNLHDFQSIESQNVDVDSQRRLRDVYRNSAVQIVALAIEDRMILDLNDDIEISRRSTIATRLPLARQPQMRPVIHAGRNINLQLPIGPDIRLALALLARPPDNFS